MALARHQYIPADADPRKRHRNVLVAGTMPASEDDLLTELNEINSGMVVF